MRGFGSRAPVEAAPSWVQQLAHKGSLVFSIKFGVVWKLCLSLRDADSFIFMFLGKCLHNYTHFQKGET